MPALVDIAKEYLKREAIGVQQAEGTTVCKEAVTDMTPKLTPSPPIDAVPLSHQPQSPGGQKEEQAGAGPSYSWVKRKKKTRQQIEFERAERCATERSRIRFRQEQHAESEIQAEKEEAVVSQAPGSMGGFRRMLPWEVARERKEQARSVRLAQARDTECKFVALPLVRGTKACDEEDENHLKSGGGKSSKRTQRQRQDARLEQVHPTPTTAL